ncbi:dephospho-CoA kinase [uncultured Slackia sp.]|uniref:dephospho-CoA kinase n=1 Tax=uncultured Slackia sp. TaxID=665903 RepID=UPI0025E96807|nr:dephospho-CoA kinase [uncultured Slackia sp.]
MTTAALIGGIGSGKSTISSMFAQLGAGIISLDTIGHYVLTMPEVKFDLARTFGAGIFDEKGEVVRPRLAQAAFDTPEHTEWLNGITHPAIMKECRRRIKELSQIHPVVLAEVTSGEISHKTLPWADVIVAVSAPEDMRIARAVERGEQTEADVKARIALQLTDEEREAVADYVIHNDGSLESTQAQVQEVWQALTR